MHKKRKRKIMVSRIGKDRIDPPEEMSISVRRGADTACSCCNEPIAKGEVYIWDGGPRYCMAVACVGIVGERRWSFFSP